ncbi:zinc ribbon domain-containing protein [Arthrobacter halodurans]|uniref:Zinc ribbon domain-containing protein n=1 Tax=Arthrobacter halodurans TaxID=516699 RepID=A0ABV4UJK1_9MICC
MAKAPQSEQHKLLALQSFDSKLTKLQRRAAELANDPAVAAALAARNAADAVRDGIAAEMEEAKRAVAASEHEVERVQMKLDKDRQRIDLGKGTARDMMALQHEIDSLTPRKAELEDAELELMEAFEAVAERHAVSAAAAERAAAGLAEAEGARDAELETLSRERESVTAQRAELVSSIDPGLVAIYEKRLAQHGVGAARLFHGTSEGSGMQLAPGDLAEIKAAAEDDVVFCPDSGCILVRSDEWNSAA